MCGLLGPHSLCAFIHADVYACLRTCCMFVYSFRQAYGCVCVSACETLQTPAAVLLGGSIGWIIKGPGGRPIGSAVITVPGWHGPMG